MVLRSNLRLRTTRIAGALLAVAVLGCAAFYAYAGLYGFQVLLRRGGSVWRPVSPDDARLSPSMRLALTQPAPEATAGAMEWRDLADGFAVAEMPVLAAGREVDRVLLTRIDPARFRFQVRSLPSGRRTLRDWATETGAAVVINGSYYGRDGTPDTPVSSNGVRLGPSRYDGRHGVFSVSGTTTRLQDLADVPWETVLAGADDAMVSYPILLAPDGSHRVRADGRWLANRSFVAEDRAGRIVLGTTMDAFFSLERLATFLRTAPLDLRIALNLDGGPVACQAVTLGTYRRDFCGRWETTVHDGVLQLLTWLWGERWGMPIVLTVTPNPSASR